MSEFYFYSATQNALHLLVFLLFKLQFGLKNDTNATHVYFLPLCVLTQEIHQKKKFHNVGVPPVPIQTQFHIVFSCIAICKMICLHKQGNAAAGFHSLFMTLTTFPPSAPYRNLRIEYCMRKMCARLSGASRASTERAAVLLGWHHFSFDEHTMSIQPLCIVRCLAQKHLGTRIFTTAAF